uniref:serine O-acetyltransferase n=1 Tax=Chromera velia CCMP2878 TaxID=1169474 RepID=A0A0G4IDD1_9ALVE|mmetsp:Transcript_36272/g.71357  ORF Transcript_36272/g.71357 Transcript_36272/m.71357 type:complete len:438 (-) Transcript_36272:146-1459(-)|eukprot:Cvel_2329.t1-p1 / transcript=Cvel_2329.t1 / gene=Cvel_2329 / organism=Chromera_velia_CCMP2878 / gene_product=Probable serine acetyltransferase 4, putative / transcript_product=Probable serine acetyltransferase 4, putative / location=Cvel_scaffold90:13888-15628(-) / protein_length=437 / sequence_SO=supercontig / SO=protein_coding / is_pseudo=false
MESRPSASLLGVEPSVSAAGLIGWGAFACLAAIGLLSLLSHILSILPKVPRLFSNDAKRVPSPLRKLLEEAREAMESQPSLRRLLRPILSSQSFGEAVAVAISGRIAGRGVDEKEVVSILKEAFEDETLQSDGRPSISACVSFDVDAVLERDPACGGRLEVLLFYKGFAALAAYRAAHRAWLRGHVHLALWLQSRVSEVCGVDIHPGATIGCGVMFDHGTGIVIGETAKIGDGSTLLHGVTLGGTGKERGDRHPKLGRNVLIGAGATILGNISVGDDARVGAGSVVLRSVPPGATAVGVPAKILVPSKTPPPSNAEGGAERDGAISKQQLPQKQTAKIAFGLEKLKDRTSRPSSLQADNESLVTVSVSPPPPEGETERENFPFIPGTFSGFSLISATTEAVSDVGDGKVLAVSELGHGQGNCKCCEQWAEWADCWVI